MTLAIMLSLMSASPELESIFTKRASVVVTTPGAFVVLPLSKEVLTEVQPSLSDVRLLDERGVLVPYAVQRHESAAEWHSSTALKLATVERSQTSGSEVTTLFEQMVYDLPPRIASAPTLHFRTANGDFVRMARVEVLSSANAVLVATSASLFRLKEAAVEQLAVDLPNLPEGSRRLRVTLEGQSPGYLEATASLTTRSRRPASSTLVWPVSSPLVSNNHTTHTTLERPPGFVPTALRLTTSTPWFSRQVTIIEDGRVVAAQHLLRMPREQTVAITEMPVPHLTGQALEIRIENQDSPPLEDLKLEWLVEQPELVFATTNAQQRLTLLFGGGRTKAPQFDTNAFGWTRSGDVKGVAQLGQVEPNPSYRAGSMVQSFRQPGALFDVTSSPYQARVARWAAKEALVRLALGPEQASTMADGFRDVRLVDASGHQWPYVMRIEERQQPVALSPPKVISGWAHSRAEPRGQIVGLTLSPAPGTPFFSRWVRMHWVAAGKEPHLLWEGSLVHNPSDRGEPTSLSVRLPRFAARQGVLDLSVGSIDDGLLEGLALEVTVQAPTLRTVAPPGDYRLVWGNKSLAKPQYDLMHATDLLAELREVAVTPTPAEDNPDYRVPSLFEQTGGATRWVLWAALLAAVLGLSGFAVRVVRRDDAPPMA